MSSSATDPEVHIPKSSTPGLDPQQFAVLIQRSSSEIKDEHVDPLNSSSESFRKPVNHKAIAKLRGSINGVPPRAKSPFEKLWRDHRDLLISVGICLVTLCIMSVTSINWFNKRDQVALRWDRLMETAGFVDWPRLEDPSSLPAICAATPIVVGVASAMVVPWSLFTRQAGGIKLFAYAMSGILIMSIIGCVLALQNSTNDDIIESLTSQADAVAGFNSGFCKAWCRNSDAGLAAFVRGDCGPKQKTLFDDATDHFDMKEWCLQAIAHQNFDLVAEYSGVSPFAGLKGAAGRALTDVRPTSLANLHVCFALMLQMFAVTVLIDTSSSFGNSLSIYD